MGHRLNGLGDPVDARVQSRWQTPFLSGASYCKPIEIQDSNTKLSKIYKDTKFRKPGNNVEIAQSLESLSLEVEEGKKKIEEIKETVVDKYNPIPEKYQTLKLDYFRDCTIE